MRFETLLNTLPVLATMGIAMVRLLPSFNNLSTISSYLKSQKISSIAVILIYKTQKNSSNKFKSKLRI